MQSCLSILLGLVVSLSVGAEPLVEGHVRLESGQPVAGAQVRLFDLADLAAGPIARATTDATGAFALAAGATGQAIPQGFTLGQNYPNPFNPSTVIPYQLPTAMPVQLAVFNLLGQRVATLVAGERAAGAHTAHWDGTNAAGQAVGAGVYLYRLSGAGVHLTRRMVLLDGQAGIVASGGFQAAVPASVEPASVSFQSAAGYGLTVSGPGLVASVEPALKVGAAAAPVEVIVHAVGAPSSGQASMVMPAWILGDVDNNGRVDGSDALLVALYSRDASVVLPNHGTIAIGDVNADGRVDRADAGLLGQHAVDPSDPALPAGLAKPVANTSEQDEHDYDYMYMVGEAIEPLTFPEAPGGTGSKTYSMSGLPPGLSFDPATRTLSGTPTTAGTYEAIYTVTDAVGASASFPPIVIVVKAADPPPEAPGELMFVVGEAIEPLTFPEAPGGTGSKTYSMSGLPPGLSFDPATRTLSGTPTTAGTYEAIYTVTDAVGASASFPPIVIVVNPSTDPMDDRAVLVALYEATNGDEWTNNTNWMSDRPLDEWFGVTTDENGRVTALNLRENRLSGALPAELGSLTHLRELTLFINQLSGTLPSSLGNLTNLELLWLGRNQFSGTLPTSLGNLTHLKRLWLGYNQFSGMLPAELGNLTHLESLWLGHNQFSDALPSSLVNLTNVQELNLENTQLCAPTDAVFQAWLESIDDKQGVVNCGPDLINPDRAALVALYEATNGDEWTNNTNWLSDRPLDEWYGVTTDDDGRVTRLQLSDNRLSGTLPASLGNLTNLRELTLFINQLSGTLPASLGNLTNLQLLYLNNNRFSGTLPAWLGNLTNLQWLALDNNQFSGVLPPSLGNLTNLQTLWLNNNQQLSGTLPLSLGNLTNLQWLWLDNTQLCAPTDAAFQRWLEGIENKRGVVNCESLPVAVQRLTAGPLSVREDAGRTEITLTVTLAEAPVVDETVRFALVGPRTGTPAQRDVDFNATLPLEATITIKAGETEGTATLILTPIDNRREDGDRSLGVKATASGGSTQTDITIIDDEGITPSGPDPTDDRAALLALYEATNGDNWTNNTNWLSDQPLGEWFGVTTDANGRVTRLRLRENQLSGSLPSELGNLTNLQTLNLYENELWGGLPSELGNLTNLTYLNLGDNELSGALPRSLGNLTNLQQLGLFDNKLSGSLPSSLGNLTTLQELWLKGNNDLEGSLPSSLVNLTNLQTLRLEDTQLCAPTDDAFEAWLEGIDNKRGVVNCEEGEPSTAIVLSVNPQTIREGAGKTEITVTATLDGQALSEDATVRLTISSESTALRDEDFTIRLNRIVIPAGSIAGSNRSSVTTIDDNVAEGDETIVLIGVVDGLMGGEVVITIIDDDETSITPTPITNPDRAALVALYEATNGDEWANNNNWLSDRPLGEWYGVETDADGRVTQLDLFNNGLSGTLPSSLGDLTNLRKLRLNAGRVSGPIPPELGDLTNLEELYLDQNQLLSGPIPSELGNLTNLQSLSLWDNQLSGSIPPELGNLTNLRQLALSDNQLSGTIPLWLGNLTNLTGLWLGGNQLSGPIPSELGNLTNLIWLGLYDSQFSGSLPSSLVNLTNLTSLNLENTQLCAPLDAAFQAWLEGINEKRGVTNCADESDYGSDTPKIYWTDNFAGKIQRANLDGTDVEDFITGLDRPISLALDVFGGSKIYWATESGRARIQRANLDGTEIEDLITVSEGGALGDLALDLGADKMYWTNYQAGKIQRANLDGTDVEDFITGLDRPINLALDVFGDSKIYWTISWPTADQRPGKIQRANLDGTGIEDLITRGVSNPNLALADKIYWADWRIGKIQRANLDGTGVEDIITGVTPSGLALDLFTEVFTEKVKLYWTDPFAGKIQRANLDGTGIEDLVTGLDNPVDIAIWVPNHLWSAGKIQRANPD